MVEDDYSVDDDNRVYQMRLREGQHWHDGAPLTARDVKFTFDYALTQNQTRWKGIASELESIEISGDGEIIITLVSGNPNFLRAGLSDMPIVPGHIYESVGDATVYDGPTIGSSLYRLTEYRMNEFYVFEAFEGYFRGDARVARINMPVITDVSAVSQALIAGQISASTRSVSPETFDAFQAVAGIEILSGRGYAPVMLQFNCERGILADARFRRALTYALDIQAMLDVVTLGHAIPGLPGFYTDDMPGARTDLRYEFDPCLASSILDELGFLQKGSDGIRLSDGHPIRFELLVQAPQVTRIRTAELIKESFEAVGIGVNVIVMESDTVSSFVWPEFDVAEGRDFDLAMWGWSAPVGLNPNSLVRLGMSDSVIGNLNIGGLLSAEYDALCSAWLDTSNAAERSEISRELQRLLAELAPFVNLWYDNVSYAVNTNDYDGWVIQTGAGVINRYTFLG